MFAKFHQSPQWLLRMSVITLLVCSVGFLLLPAHGDDVQYCPKCGTENPLDAKYCVKCGEPLLEEFMQYLLVTAPTVNLYLGDVGNDIIMGTADKGTVMDFKKSGSGRYQAQLGGPGFWVLAWVDKASVKRSLNDPRSGPISEALNMAETSEQLGRNKRNILKLVELQKYGHISYQGAIRTYMNALKAEAEGTKEARERARRYWERGDKMKEVQDKYLQIMQARPDTSSVIVP
jgi:hypothetical protein